MTANNDLIQAICENCDRLRTYSAETLSRHPTSDGTVVYTQCVCGRLEAWLYPAIAGDATIVARG